MKKFFSLIALVGVFAACQPEELKTVFQSRDAELTINVSKVINSVNGADVTGEATKTPYTTKGNPAIAAGVGTVSATYNGATGSLDVPYPAILADTDPVTIGVTVHIPGSVGDYDIDVKETFGDPTVKYFILEEAKNHGISHDGSLWLENASDFNLFDSCTYTDSTGEELDGEVKVFENAFAEIVNANAEVHNPGILDEEDTVYEFTIPAWSWYQVLAGVYTVPVHYDVVATPKNGAPTVGNNGVVGSFDANNVFTIPEMNKMAHPSHADHYGHYTGHGNGSNAGGGLVEE